MVIIPAPPPRDGRSRPLASSGIQNLTFTEVKVGGARKRAQQRSAAGRHPTTVSRPMHRTRKKSLRGCTRLFRDGSWGQKIQKVLIVQLPGEPCQYSQQCAAAEPGAFCSRLRCECTYGMKQSGAGCVFIDSECNERGLVFIPEIGECRAGGQK
ncbi:hypothetical protein NECAME_17121 [Necator americanus]|uniref:EB domain-containing protein n=1 Tax=Necator americanus TaxID=51031 RepID=W2TTX7_NECAM|nr:hypothetical protein NECAME_17121 [Necator americanus]ETN84507.1 hypothetical protein NECAME_17121 [Necator americanus]